MCGRGGGGEVIHRPCMYIEMYIEIRQFHGQWSEPIEKVKMMC